MTDKREGSLESISEMKNLNTYWNSDEWCELNWARIKDLSLQEILLQRAHEAVVAQARICLNCPKFTDHVSQSTFSGTILLSDCQWWFAVFDGA
jgi:hypothetical protein